MVDDSAFYDLTPEQLLEGVRELAHGGQPSAEVAHVLERSGLAAETGLTNAGTALFKTAWVLKKQDDALTGLGLAVRSLTPVQVIEQELNQFGAVPEDGALDLLKLHRAAPLDLPVEAARKTFRQLSRLGLVVYSTKYKTVRALTPPPDEARAGEERSLAAMVSPKTPYMNVARLRRILRSLSGTVWWADRHFGARALEELAEELNPDRVKQLRILSGSDSGVLSPRSMKDYQRFREEMQHKGIVAEWRADAAASDWHDRWLVGNDGAWNMPPVNTLFKNDHSEMLPTDARPPLEEWWARAAPRT